MSEVEIDDRDSAIIWTGLWARTGFPSEHDDTVSGSVNAGNTAIVPFTGTSITVYGTIPKAQKNISSISQYSLDGGPLEGTFIQTPSPNIQFQQRFFASPELPYGLHQLHILDTITSDGLWLDFFIVTTGLVSNTLPVTLAQSNSLPRPTSPDADNPTAVTAGFPQASVSGKPSSKPHVEPWVIAVSLAIGGCALIVALILTIYSLRRLRRSRHEMRAAGVLEPFPVGLQQSSQDIAVSLRYNPSFFGAHRKAALGVTRPAPLTRRSDITPSGTDIGPQSTNAMTQPPRYSENIL